ncbi:formylmethanofuran dehydrogenase subunit C [Azospirillum halopraeferens]|uniref:formylmethanofuran dehydrogenase subunit C n=1 Tax=Azospirillum halopraeferens TaxID=34010 RepID=UPI0003FE0FE7|nr:formylmethanofuran dehydrogenase subunit C [Azospirillum halopraeferens]
MSTLTLTLRERPLHRIDASALLPARLAGLGPAGLAALTLTVGMERLPLGELFAIDGTPGDTLVLRGPCDRLDRIGAGLDGGCIVVEGDAGGEAGCGMSGGVVRVQGAAGARAGAEMSGGTLEVAGDAGPFAGAGRPGSTHGMTGGTLIVRGNAGERAGDRMKRGLIVVEGDAGPGAASRLIAGTLVVAGTVGPHAGPGMRRGTLLLGRAPAALPPTFLPAGRHDLVVLRLLRRHLAGISAVAADLLADGRPVDRFVGCTGAAGRGEVLVAAG